MRRKEAMPGPCFTLCLQPGHSSKFSVQGHECPAGRSCLLTTASALPLPIKIQAPGSQGTEGSGYKSMLYCVFLQIIDPFFYFSQRLHLSSSETSNSKHRLPFLEFRPQRLPTDPPLALWTWASHLSELLSAHL